jgi:hypothetical protein
MTGFEPERTLLTIDLALEPILPAHAPILFDRMLIGPRWAAGTATYRAARRWTRHFVGSAHGVLAHRTPT